MKLSNVASVVLAAVALACDHSPDASLVTTPAPTTAGSFELDNTCATILESGSGGIYTFSKQSILTLTVDSRKADGTVVWSKTLPSGNISCVAAVAASNNVVVAASDSVFSINGQTGEIRWRIASRFVRAIATSSTGRIFLSQDASSLNPFTLYAFSDTDGSPLWSKVVDGPGAPFVDDVRSTVYQVRRGGAAAIDIATGNVKWQTPLESALTTDAAIGSDGSIMVSQLNDFSGAITAYTPDGTRVWRNPGFAARQTRGSPIVDDAGTVYTATRKFDGAGVYALSTTTGETKWKREFYDVFSNVAVDANRTVYVLAQASPDSTVTLYGLRDGAIVSATPGRDPTFDGLITIHSNHLLYYAAGHTVFFAPTAGVSSSAPWPVDRHDAKRSGRR